MNSPADVVYETMNLDMRVLEVDPIHRRIVLARDEHSGGAAAASGDAVEVLPMDEVQEEIGYAGIDMPPIDRVMLGGW